MKRVHVGAYWGSRKDSAEACSRRLSLYLEQLAAANPLFGNWRQTGWSKSEAELLEIDSRQLEKLLLEDARGRESSLGYMFGFWNENDVGDSCKLQGACGISNGVGWNSVSLRLPFKTTAASHFLDLHVLKKLTELTASIWKPAWVEVSTADIVALNVPPDSVEALRTPRIGWLTWLPYELRLLPVLPTPVRTETSVAKGTLITIVGPEFDVENLEHKELIKVTRERLLNAGILSAQP